MTNRQIVLGAIIIGIPSTMVTAMRHELGWTLVGLIALGLNINAYFNIE